MPGTQRYARGVALTPLERGERTSRTGTRIRFRADRTIFGPAGFDRDEIRERLREVAWFNPNLTFDLMAERIAEPRGLAGAVEQLASECGVEDLGEVFVTRGLRDGILVEVALAWSGGGCSHLHSFVGQRPTHDGATHESGFWRGVVRAVAMQSRAFSRPPRVSRVRRRLAAGLLAIVHVDLRAPRFCAPTRDRLKSREAGLAVCDLLSDALGGHLAERPNLARELLARLA